MKPYMYQPRAASCVEVRNRRRNSSSSANLEFQSELDDSSSAEASTCANSDSQHLGLSARPDSLHGIPESYVQPRPDLMRSSDRYPGLMEDGRGDLYAVDGENVYAVRRDPDNATWRVYDRQAPSRPAYPIRPAQGGWEVHGDVGLRGGMLRAGGAFGARGAKARPGESIEAAVSSWIRSDKQYISLTKRFSPQELQRKDFKRKPVMVSDDVFNRLSDAQKINEATNVFLPYGAANQKWDVESTGGEVVKRWYVSRARHVKSGRELVEFRAGAGNCGEMSALAFALAGGRFKNSPVMRVREDRMDHWYVLVGDPRDSQYGESTVVIDAWPLLPTAHTLGEGTDNPNLPSAQVSSHEPFVRGHLPLLPSDYIDAEYSRLSGKSADEASVLRDHYAWNAEEHFMYDHRTSSNDPSTVYRSASNPTGRVFDKLPDYVVERYDPYIRVRR